jgi:uncharacterized membrane protein YeaQ/YmgE (transglycosylase-associated protein family)
MFLVWIISGLVSGLVASQIVNQQNMDVLSHIVLGIIGSLVGAFLFDNVFKPDVIGSQFWSVFTSVVCSIGWLIAYYAIAGRAGDTDTD